MASVVVRGRIPGREGTQDVLLDVASAPTARGMIRLGGTVGGVAAAAPAPTVAEATARAVRAFQRGVFAMFAGAGQVRELDRRAANGWRRSPMTWG